MSTPFWSGLSEEQWAEAQMLMSRVDRLNAMLLAEQIANAQLRGEATTAAEKHARAEEDARAEQTHLKGRLAEAEADAQRDRDRLVMICRNLTPLVVEWLTHYEAFADEALTKDTREMKESALELLRLMTPFSE